MHSENAPRTNNGILNSKITTQTAIMILLMLLAALTSCTAGGQSTESPLDGSSWVLTSINHNKPLDGTQATLLFQGGNASGNGGCNTYSGTYETSGEEILIGPLVQTEMDCREPEGTMDQERTFLATLGEAKTFRLEDETLTIFSDEGQTLVFTNQSLSTSVGELPQGQPSPIPPTPTNDSQSNIPLPPDGFKAYQDTAAGISIFIPDEWHVTGIVEGEYAIFTSYPKDKYIGGEPRSPEDTKCDLNLHPDFTGDYQALVEQWKSDSFATVMAEQEVHLNSGQPATRIEIDNRGVSISMVTGINDRVVSLTCWGSPNLFDRMAGTLHASK